MDDECGGRNGHNAGARPRPPHVSSDRLDRCQFGGRRRQRSLFCRGLSGHILASTQYGSVAGGLHLALALFGAWMATGVAFWSAHWLVLHERFSLSRSWLPIAPLVGLGFMATQFLINIWSQWLIGSAAICVAAVAAGWIIGALQWML